MENVERGGKPFACVIPRGGEIVAGSPNIVVQTDESGLAVYERWHRLNS